MITREDLEFLLHYDPETGEFTWKNPTSRKVKAGTIAGSKDKDNYTVIKVLGKNYKAHRLAWLYMTGGWPKGIIDHVNRCTSDNRWENLRVVTDKQNSYNRSPRKNTTSRYKGVHFVKHMKKWVARITKNGDSEYLGFFESEIDAAVAYNRRAKELFGPYTYLNEV